MTDIASAHGTSPPKSEVLTWPDWAMVMRPHVADRYQSTFLYFCEWMKKHEPELWTGDPEFHFPDAESSQSPSPARGDHHQSRQALLDHAKTSSQEPQLAGWWDRLICAGNLDGRWKIPLLGPVVKAPRPRTTLVRHDFQLLTAYRRLEDAFWESCLEPSASEHLGDLAFLSAVLNGGLFNLQDIAALLSITPKSFTGSSGRLVITLNMESKSGETWERQWYPDSVTAVLLVRALREKRLPHAFVSSRSEPVVIWAAVRARLNRLKLPAVGKARGDFLRAARVAYLLRITPMSVAYCAGETTSRSLPKHLLFNLCGWKSPSLEHPSLTLQGSPGGETKVIPPLHEGITPRAHFDGALPPVDQMKFVGKLQRMLDRRICPQSEIDQLLSQHRGQLWPLVVLLVEWVKWLMNKEIRGSAIRASSAKRYLGAIARHLMDAAEAEDPLDMDPEDFETLYEYAASRIRSTQERGVFWGRIRSFHDFLTLHGAPDINLPELDGYTGPTSARTSVNLITEEQFATFVNDVIALKLELTPTTWLVIVAILGFRLGLRRREIQTLWLDDVHLGSEPCIMVRPSKLAALKSHAAARRIPLTGLVPIEEIHLIRSYVETRQRVHWRKTALLFCYDHSPTLPIAPHILFDPITAAFNALTAGNGIPFRFHHLRHSFANWLFLKLVCADQPNLRGSEFPPIIDKNLGPVDTETLKSAMFPRLPGTPQTPTRRNLYLVAALLGHLSPETSLKHYIHVVDWVAGEEIEQDLGNRILDFGSSKLGRLCGLSPSMPHKAPYRDYVDQPLLFLREFIKHNLPRRHQATLAPKKKPVDLSFIRQRRNFISFPHPMTMMAIMSRRIQGTTSERLAEIHDVPARAIDDAILDYHHVYAKQSSTLDIADLPLPTPPRTMADRIEFHQILESTYSAFNAKSKRPGLLAAARLLIRRPGPTTGRLYPGPSAEETSAVVTGLIDMGINPSLISIYCPGRSSRSKAANHPHNFASLKNMGVIILAGDKHPNKSRGQSRNYLVEISDRRKVQSSKLLARAEGRIRGLNYLAAWFSFAFVCIKYCKPDQT